MKEFEDWYKNEPKDFHLWSQSQLMEYAWKAALGWVKSRSVHRLISVNEIDEELDDGS